MPLHQIENKINQRVFDVVISVVFFCFFIVTYKRYMWTIMLLINAELVALENTVRQLQASQGQRGGQPRNQ